LMPWGDENVIVKGVEATDGLSAKITEGAPFRTPGAGKPYTVTVQLEPQQRRGRFVGAVNLHTNNERIPECQVRISAQIIGVECEVTPQVIAFGPALPGEAVGTIAVLPKAQRLNALTPLPRDQALLGTPSLTITGATCDIPGVQLDILNEERLVRLHLTDDVPPGRKVGAVRVEIEEGHLNEVRKVSVYGSVAGAGVVDGR